MSRRDKLLRWAQVLRNTDSLSRESPSATALLGQIARDTGLPIRSRTADFNDGGIADLADHDQWALLSVHAIEQSPKIDMRWLEDILRERPPVVGIHVEPMHDGAGTPFARDERAYTCFLSTAGIWISANRDPKQLATAGA
jgi:hypothetical protein